MKEANLPTQVLDELGLGVPPPDTLEHRFLCRRSVERIQLDPQIPSRAEIALTYQLSQGDIVGDGGGFGSEEG